MNSRKRSIFVIFLQPDFGALFYILGTLINVHSCLHCSITEFRLNFAENYVTGNNIWEGVCSQNNLNRSVLQVIYISSRKMSFLLQHLHSFFEFLSKILSNFYHFNFRIDHQMLLQMKNCILNFYCSVNSNFWQITKLFSGLFSRDSFFCLSFVCLMCMCMCSCCIDVKLYHWRIQFFFLFRVCIRHSFCPYSCVLNRLFVMKSI